MKKLIALAVLLALNGGWAAAPELFSLEIKDAPVENGKAMTWTFREIERRPTSSIVEVVTETGGSISGFTFLIRGMCGVAKARGEQFFTTKELSRSPMRIEVLFQKVAPDPASFGRLDPGEQKVFSMAECDMVESMVQSAPPNNLYGVPRQAMTSIFDHVCGSMIESGPLQVSRRRCSDRVEG